MPQTKQIEVIFSVKHSPGTDEHLDQILESYFKAKGVVYKDGKILISG